MQRRRIKQVLTLRERLIHMASHAREQAKSLPAGKERATLLKKARQSETASDIDEWLRSPGRRGPM
jgi:hypothetical protein